MTEAVSPAADDPFPEVYTATGAVFSTNFKNYIHLIKVKDSVVNEY